MAAGDASNVPVKNQAFRFGFWAFKTDGTLLAEAYTGADSEVSKDHGALADCTNEATNATGNAGNGYLDLTAAEMNADTVQIKITFTNTDAAPVVATIYPAGGRWVEVGVSHTYTNDTSSDTEDVTVTE